MFKKVRRIFSVFLFLILFFSGKVSVIYAQTSSDWSMAGANPARTSWVSQEVSGSLNVEWYRPIEAYIPQHVQLVAFNNMIYVSTGKGLYALNATNGDTVWRFDTQLPLGHSPTIFENVVYVGGFDHKLYALNAATGQLYWSYEAGAGFSANPLVIKDSYTNNQTLVLIGNRDGNFYAIGGQGHPSQGNVVWRYVAQNQSSFQTSAAYKDGIVYASAMNNRFYALRAGTGAVVWNTGIQIGEPFGAYWPVVWRDKVIFGLSAPYRDGYDPGTMSMNMQENKTQFIHAEIYDFNQVAPDNVLGVNLGPESWSGGYDVYEPTVIREYLETPNAQEQIGDTAGLLRPNHKPWRKKYFVINQSNGQEFTFDSDNDGLSESIPVIWWGVESGPMYPPAVGSNNILYITTSYTVPQGIGTFTIRGIIAGWNLDSPNKISMAGSRNYARDEPLSLSMGGNRIYTSLCCDRVAASYGTSRTAAVIEYWPYLTSGTAISRLAPGYDEMWYIWDGAISRHQGTYVGARDWYSTSDDGIKTSNGVFNSHGVQNPFIPHNGRLFIHRSNAIIALGTGTSQGKKNYLPVQSSQTSVSTPNLNSILDNEIQKIVSAGLLKPGYYNQGQGNIATYGMLPTYFINPGDTLMALTLAYPHLNQTNKTSVATYLRDLVWPEYFSPIAYSQQGWSEGEERHPAVRPPEVVGDYQNHPKQLYSNGHAWNYPQHNLYALWKYAANIPESARPTTRQIYDLAKSKVKVPATSDSYFMTNAPYDINSQIAGYNGFLQLQTLAGMVSTDGTLRTNVTNELNRLLTWRASAFSKESFSFPTDSIRHKYDTARNFIWLTPELGDYLAANATAKVNTALAEYQYLNQYWFVNRFENDMGESGTQTLYNYHALFLAKAYILNEPREELIKYLDVPAFERGDLFYIQNLVAAIEAPSNGDPTPTVTQTPTPVDIPGDANGDRRVDGADYVIWLSHFSQNVSGASSGDFNNDGVVNGADYVIWLTNYN